ncbi:hypothetical protein GCM10023213_43670 [Prosthecobacter algae]|uniref:Uncharacterized protein n=1 Tax=Prosthecobacter algae TaxID=1144682 RepID=A0ABP9PRY0_9BACT
MTQPRYDSTISLGHVVQILSLVIAGATAWGVHTSTLRHLELLRNEDRQRLESHDVKIQLLERSTDVVKTDVNYIRLTVDEIKRDLKQPTTR